MGAKKIEAQQSSYKLSLAKDLSLYNFQSHFLPTLFYRFISIYLFITIFHFLNSDLFVYKEYIPLLLTGTKKIIFLKTLGVLLIAYIATPHEEAQATIKGIKCYIKHHSFSESMDQIIYSSDIETCGIFTFFRDQQTITWDNIKNVKQSRLLFCPVLNIYDKDMNKIGFMYFSLKDKNKFFDFIKEHAGSDHPLLSLQKK